MPSRNCRRLKQDASPPLRRARYAHTQHAPNVMPARHESLAACTSINNLSAYAATRGAVGTLVRHQWIVGAGPRFCASLARRHATWSALCVQAWFSTLAPAEFSRAA